MQRCAPSSCMAQPSLTHLRRSVCEEGERRKMKDVTIERGAGRIGTGKARHRASGLHTTARTHQRARGGEGKRLAGRSAQLKSLSFLGFWTVSGSAPPIAHASWRVLTYLLTYRRTDRYSSPAFSARSTARRSAGPGRIAVREGRVRGHAARSPGARGVSGASAGAHATCCVSRGRDWVRVRHSSTQLDGFEPLPLGGWVRRCCAVPRS